jgi:hypothetical protein
MKWQTKEMSNHETSKRYFPRLKTLTTLKSKSLILRKIANLSKPLRIPIEWRQWRRVLTKNPNPEMPPSVLHLEGSMLAS